MIMIMYALVMSALGCVMVFSVTWNVPVWAAIGVISTCAVVIGVIRNAPRQRVFWLVIAAAVLLSTVGDALYGLSSLDLAGLPLLAEVCYFCILPLLLIGLIGLTRASVVLGDRTGLLDMVAFACATALIAWIFVIGPALAEASLSPADRATIALCVLGDLLAFVVTVRLVVAARRSWTVLFLAMGSLGALWGDISYTFLQLNGGWSPGAVSEIGYFLMYACQGGAALHPSMVELTSPVDTRPERLTRPATGLVRLSLLIPSGALLVGAAMGRTGDVAVVAIASIVIGELVITRLTDIVERHRRSVRRERVLRQACGELVRAVDTTEISTALRESVDRLMPSGVQYEAVVSIRDEFAPSAVDCFGEPLLAGLSTLPTPSEERRTELARARDLGWELPAGLRAFDAVLVCPLVPCQRALGDPGTGVLLIAGRRRALEPMRDAAEVLTAQTILAMERVVLMDLVNRKDGDTYLRTVVRNTTDVVLVVDPDDRIRYASPSLAALWGVEHSACATLYDIVHPNDHQLVTRAKEQARDCPDGTGTQDVWNLLRPDGSRVLVDIDLRDLCRDRMVRGFVVTMRDVEGRRAQEQESIRRSLEGTSGWQNRNSSMRRFR